MNATDNPHSIDSITAPSRHSWHPLTPPVAAGLLSWAAISLGFLGLKMLMQERPEFVGQPTRGTKTELVQEAPQVVARKVTDDISVIKPVQPDFSDVRFDLKGRRDGGSRMAIQCWGRAGHRRERRNSTALA